MAADYAWIITHDHLEDDLDQSDAGITGPSDAPEDLLDRVKAGEGHVFELYDGDGNLCYTGLLMTERYGVRAYHCYAPLDDFGIGWAGCVEVRWPDHPEWNC